IPQLAPKLCHRFALLHGFEDVIVRPLWIGSAPNPAASELVQERAPQQILALVRPLHHEMTSRCPVVEFRQVARHRTRLRLRPPSASERGIAANASTATTTAATSAAPLPVGANLRIISRARF